MLEKTFGKKPPQETEPLHLNNFYCYLPGGAYRRFYDSSPEMARIMDAVDKLLQEEFSDLNIQKIVDQHHEAQDVVKEMFDFSVQRTEEENDALEKKLNVLKLAGQEGDDKLRPLFKRLIVMGFNAKNLAG